MKIIAPKYFHYFLVLILFDSVLLSGVYGFFFTTENLLTILSIWVISHFINYPRVAARRYISYYKLLIQTVHQILLFYALYCGFSLWQNGHIETSLFLELTPILSVAISRILFVFGLRYYRTGGKGFNRFLIIGKTPVMDDLTARFLAKKSYGHILEDQYNEFDLKKIEFLILKRDLNEIYCSSRNVTQDDLSKLLNLSFKYGVGVHVVADNGSEEENYSSAIAMPYADLNLEQYPLMDRKNLIIKRIVDFTFSLFVMVTVLSWVIPIMWILIKLESRGPLFFKQPRSGRNGKYFTCLKFRSMRTDVDKGKNVEQATKNDARVTKVGRVIRKLSIDELPQFINVLRGHMSVVGPRPHFKDLNDKYDTTINNYTNRALVKPGVTGLSQITGHRGETSGEKSMANRIKIDILYIKSWKWYLDIIIIYKTVFDVFLFRNEDAY